MAVSRSSGKSTYASWLHDFDQGKGSQSDHVLEAFLAYWLSWYFLPSGMDDGLHQFVFPLAKATKFALALLHLGTLYARISEFVQNNTKSANATTW